LRILALDLSLTATGWCCDGTTGVIKPKVRGWERINQITSAILDLRQDADLVVLEGYSYGSQGRAIVQIHGLGEIVRYKLWKAEVPYADVPPSTLKKFATGKGNAGKDEMISCAIRKFGFEGCDNNEADAFMLWQMAQQHYAPVVHCSLYEAEAVAKVEWPEVGR